MWLAIELDWRGENADNFENWERLLLATQIPIETNLLRLFEKGQGFEENSLYTLEVVIGSTEEQNLIWKKGDDECKDKTSLLRSIF